MGLFTAGEIQVFSMRSGAKPVPSHFVQIVVDRTSVLGNKNYAKTEADRDRVCDCYDADLTRLIKKRHAPTIKALMEIVNHVAAGRSVALMCWCVPKRCHALSIKRVCESKLRRMGSVPRI